MLSRPRPVTIFGMKLHWIAVALCLSMFGSGCAVLNEDSRYLTNTLDENLEPGNTAAKVALAPLGITAGLAALAIDGAIINPIAQLPEATSDAVTVFTDIDYVGPFELIVFPMRIVTFVVIFTGSELGRCTLPL